MRGNNYSVPSGNFWKKSGQTAARLVRKIAVEQSVVGIGILKSHATIRIYW